MSKCAICGTDEMFHVCAEGGAGSTMGGEDASINKRGLFMSLSLAFDIVTGSLRLLRRYPVFIAPLVPVFLMLLVLEFGLLTIAATDSSLRWAWSLLFAVAYCLMFSFAITSSMLQQIHAGQKPSLSNAIGAPGTRRMIAKVFFLTAVWFTLVLILVAVEMAVKALVSRLSERLADYVAVFFDTFASALRMMGFMLIPIMIFEKVGLQTAYQRLKITLRNSPVSALSGLALTKMTSFLILLVIAGLSAMAGSMSETTTALLLLLGFPVLGFGWMLAMYLEQLFATGLYLYATVPQSAVVTILLEKQIGRELPAVPAPQVG